MSIADAVLSRRNVGSWSAIVCRSNRKRARRFIRHLHIFRGIPCMHLDLWPLLLLLHLLLVLHLLGYWTPIWNLQFVPSTLRSILKSSILQISRVSIFNLQTVKRMYTHVSHAIFIEPLPLSCLRALDYTSHRAFNVKYDYSCVSQIEWQSQINVKRAVGSTTYFYFKLLSKKVDKVNIIL